MSIRSLRIMPCLLWLLISATSGLSARASQPGLVPLPVRQTVGEGEFTFSAKTGMVVPDGHHDLRTYFIMRTGELTDRLFASSGGAPENRIRVAIDPQLPYPAEGYRLTVTPDEILIEGKDRSGVIYAMETLAQLIAPERRAGGPDAELPSVACQVIEDYPRFPYRAMHLDIARTFSDKERVMRYIDNMARHKLNKLHWHLSDDEGWRIEIKSYPKLTEVAAFRGGDSPVKHVYGAWDEKYGGFFTQDDIREVVDYAAFRGIEIIPEIDLPGHSRAAAKVYPEILCGGEVDTTASGDDRRNVWCATREENYRMLDEILGEVAALFPSEYLHVGGDEVDPEPWTNCPTCGPKVRAASANALNGEFMSRLDEILKKHGKKQAVWNEAMNGGNLPQESLIYGWENVEVCRKALKAGYRTVLMPAPYFYFDMRQTPEEEGMRWAGLVPTSKVYSFEPTELGVTAAEMENIEGIEGAFWAEVYLSQTPDFLDYQTYPRISALSEVAWSPKELRNWNDFKQRLEQWHYPRLVDYGIKFRIDPPTAKRVGNRVVVTPPFEGAEVRYTTDGSEPDGSSSLATQIAYDPGKSVVYRFKAFYGTAKSPAVYLDGYVVPVIKPRYKMTSSLKESSEYPFANAADYNSKTSARTAKTCNSGDWFEWVFDRPVDAGSVTLKTGSNHMGRYVVPHGRLEVSYDGSTYETVNERFSVKETFKPKPGLRAIRLTVSSEDNGEDSVIIHDLQLTTVR